MYFLFSAWKVIQTRCSLRAYAWVTTNQSVCACVCTTCATDFDSVPQKFTLISIPPYHVPVVTLHMHTQCMQCTQLLSNDVILLLIIALGDTDQGVVDTLPAHLKEHERRPLVVVPEVHSVCIPLTIPSVYFSS